jgi:hypothetical protein
VNRAFVSCIVRSFALCIARSYFVSCVRLIKLTNGTKKPITRTKIERTIYANGTNDKRKRYELFANFNDQGFVTHDWAHSYTLYSSPVKPTTVHTPIPSTHHPLTHDWAQSYVLYSSPVSPPAEHTLIPSTHHPLTHCWTHSYTLYSSPLVIWWKFRRTCE